MHKPGELLCHPRHGVGIVLEIQEIAMNNNVARYYLMEMATGDKMMIPVSQTGDGSLTTVPAPDAINQTLSAPPQALPVDFRQRANEVERKVTSGDSLLLAEVLRDLTWKMKTSKLSTGDIRMLEVARKLLANMLVVKPHMDLREAGRRLDQMLQQAALAWSVSE